MLKYKKYMCEPIGFDETGERVIMVTQYLESPTFAELLAPHVPKVVYGSLAATWFSATELEELRQVAERSGDILGVKDGRYFEEYGWRFRACLIGKHSTSEK